MYTRYVNCVICRKGPRADRAQFSLDIEATVADGALAIGVFGWESMLGLEEAEGVVKDLAGVLREGFMA